MLRWDENANHVLLNFRLLPEFTRDNASEKIRCSPVLSETWNCFVAVSRFHLFCISRNPYPIRNKLQATFLFVKSELDTCSTLLINNRVNVKFVSCTRTYVDIPNFIRNFGDYFTSAVVFVPTACILKWTACCYVKNAFVHCLLVFIKYVQSRWCYSYFARQSGDMKFKLFFGPLQEYINYSCYFILNTSDSSSNSL